MKSLIYTCMPLLFLCVACGGPPAANSMLSEARSVYTDARNDPLVIENAPVALEQAGEYLKQSEAIWQDKGDEDKLEHYAYLARQRSLVAQEMAKLNLAEQGVEEAEAVRQRVLIEARTAEAEKAEREAEVERLAAEKAKKEAEMALARARELSERVSELEANQTERGLVLTLSAVLFDVGKATLKPGAQSMVNELTAFLNEYDQRTVLIEGFTDSSGSEDFNLTLSQRRAEAVRTALLYMGISAQRIQVRGYGEAYPVASNATLAGRQQNRRVEIIISDEEGHIVPREP